MRMWIAVIALVALGTPFLAVAQHENHQHAGARPEPAKTTAAPALKQTTCPVTRKPISQDAFIDHEGRKVFFCSKGCINKFQEEPNAYLSALYAQWYPQSVQITCPVMGDEVDGKTFIDFKGQNIAFCCDECPKKFSVTPAKYLAKLGKASTQQVHCPVTGQAIDPKISTDYQGKPVYFNSQEALAKFKADLRKYAEKLLPEQGLLARGPTADEDLVVCPICAEGGSGVHARKQVKTVVLNGKVYSTCSKGCEEKLKSNLAKYEPIIQAQTEKVAANNKWYTCPMHPDVLQKGPGKCPKCSMDLQPLNKEKTGAAPKTPATGHGGHQH